MAKTLRALLLLALALALLAISAHGCVSAGIPGPSQKQLIARCCLLLTLLPACSLLLCPHPRLRLSAVPGRALVRVAALPFHRCTAQPFSFSPVSPEVMHMHSLCV